MRPPIMLARSARDPDEYAWELRLERDGLIEWSRLGARTTPHWHAVFSRAALKLFHDGEEVVDIRVPIAAALSDRYPAIEAAELATGVRVILPIAVRDLSALGAAARGDHLE